MVHSVKTLSIILEDQHTLQLRQREWSMCSSRSTTDRTADHRAVPLFTPPVSYLE